jgi:hypothetical protein
MDSQIYPLNLSSNILINYVLLKQILTDPFKFVTVSLKSYGPPLVRKMNELQEKGLLIEKKQCYRGSHDSGNVFFFFFK